MKTTSATLLGMILLSPLVAALVITRTQFATKVVTTTGTCCMPEVATMTATPSRRSADMSTIGPRSADIPSDQIPQENIDDETSPTELPTARWITLSTIMVITLEGTEVATRTWTPFGTEVVTMTITPGGPGLITLSATPSRRSADMSSIGRRGCDGDEEPLADSDGTVQHGNSRSTIGPRSADISSDQIAQYEAAKERFREQMDNMNKQSPSSSYASPPDGIYAPPPDGIYPPPAGGWGSIDWSSIDWNSIDYPSIAGRAEETEDF